MNINTKKLSFKPVSDRVVIHPEAPDKITKGGVIIADNIQQTSQKGFVVAIGPNVTSVKEGDYVYYDSVRCGVVNIGENVFHIAKDTPEGQIELILNTPIND